MVKWNRAFVDRPMSEPDQSPRWVRFGTFDVELRTGEIRKQGARFKLQEKLFQVLALLLEHAGRIVTREELRQRLWPADTFVDFDANLNTTLNKLRQAIGDSADHPRFIETIPRRGYRFIATVEPLENGAKGEPADVETARATEAPSAELRASPSAHRHPGVAGARAGGGRAVLPARSSLVGGPTSCGANDAARAALREPERRPRAGILQRRPHRRDDHTACPGELRAARSHRAGLRDAVQALPEDAGPNLA